jgi:hypothetical protein
MNRRRALTFGAAGALGLWSAPRLSAAGQEPTDAKSPLLFSAMIPGCLEASKNIREISIDELNIDARQMTTGRDNDFWNLGPGDVRLGSARFTFTGSPGVAKELQAWFQQAAKGGNIRKNISVNLRRSDNRTERAFVLADCFPSQWSNVNFDTSSTVQTETLTVKVGRIEFKT